MEEVIARKYAVALIESLDSSELGDAVKLFSQASQAFELDKFRDIVSSPCVAKTKKREFLFSIFGGDERIEAFIDLLIENNRACLIPFIYDILERHLRMLDNSYVAILYVSKSLDSNSIVSITDSLSARLGVKLRIEQSLAKIDGVRLVVQDLGVEVSFLKERFLGDLRSHILRMV